MCSGCAFSDPRYNGDLQKKYCLSCFKIGEKYVERMNDEQDKFDILIEEIEQEWIDEAMKMAKLAMEKTNKKGVYNDQ